MAIHTRLFKGAMAVAVAASAATVGAAVSSGSGSGRDTSPAPAARHAAAVDVNPWAAGNAAMARCDVLPAYYVVQDETVRAGGAGSGVNVWAAGDAAVARYFNELSRRCAPTR